MSAWGLPSGLPFFPHPTLSDEDGLLAYGSDLTPELILSAYHYGIFPWCNEGDPVLWWHTSPRCVLFPSKIKTSKSMRSFLRKTSLKVTFNTAFEKVIHECAQDRAGQDGGTWIRDDLKACFSELHQKGHAHSVEVWERHELVGGLYGLSLGKIFFGESMFSRIPNASKTALITLSSTLENQGFTLIDCQQTTPHLISMGAEEISRDTFLDLLRKNRQISLQMNKTVL